MDSDDIGLVECLGGRRAAPPEDCGGPLGYEEVLAALEQPERPESPELLERLPHGFDPGRFDAGEVTDELDRVGR